MNKKDLYRREYLRGLIDGSQKPLKKGYALSTLVRRYREYLKSNPSVKEELLVTTRPKRGK